MAHNFTKQRVFGWLGQKKTTKTGNSSCQSTLFVVLKILQLQILMRSALSQQQEEENLIKNNERQVCSFLLDMGVSGFTIAFANTFSWRFSTH